MNSYICLINKDASISDYNRYPDETLSTQIIGERQFQKAVDLFTSAKEELTGKIDYRHVYLNFTDIEVELEGNKVVKTCPAALGPGFAAGTTDGPGAFGFQQGDTKVHFIKFECSFFHLLLKLIIELRNFNADQQILEKTERCT